MIKTRKIQLFKTNFFVATFLFILLCCILTVATLYEPVLFHTLAAGMALIIIYLIFLNTRVVRRQAAYHLKLQDIRERRNLLQAEMRHEDVAIQSFRQKIIRLSNLKNLTEKLSLCHVLDDTTKQLSEEVSQQFGNKDSTIILYLFHNRTGELGLTSSQKGQMRINIKSKNGDEFDHWVVRTMQPLLIENMKKDFRFDIEKIKTEDERNIGSLMSVPLLVGNKALGILRIDIPEENYFSTADIRFLTTISDLGAVAIENAQLYERVQQLAIRDGLTGLYLRRYFLERTNSESLRQLRRDVDMSFLMIDIDHFKQYNDKFGHTAGDIVLKIVGDILDSFFNEPGSLICRYGGEEFAVLLPDCSTRRAVKLSEKVREQIQCKTVLLRREKTSVTVSIGIAAFPKDAKEIEDLIHKADQAMYAAKHKGRNCVCVYNECD